MSHLHGGKCCEPNLPAFSETALHKPGDEPRHPCGFGHIFGEPERGERFRGFGLDSDENLERTRKLLGDLAHHIQSRQVTEANAGDWENPDIPAGYTYLAQLMGHDLILTSLPATLLEGVGRPVMNSRCSGLELQTIFGGGPSARPAAFAYAGMEARTRLRLDRTRLNGENPPRGPQRDLPRVIEFEAPDIKGCSRRIGCRDTLVADPRNDDNTNLSQLCVLFSLFHNAVLDRLIAMDGSRRAVGTGEMARAITAHAYRNVIRRDLMKRLLHPRVYEFYDRARPDFLDAERHPAKMPVEFAHSVSRIGHAMIRPSYLIRTTDRGQRPLSRVLDLSPGRQPFALPLTDDWIIEWRTYFDFDGYAAAANRSARILPHLVPVLTAPRYVERVDKAPGSAPGLLFRDLSRGAAAGVRSVESLARILSQRLPEPLLAAAPMLRDGELRRREIERWLLEPESRSLSGDQISQIAGDPPLIFYVLLEAAREGGSGRHLGVLGSVIIAEVVFRALSRDAAIVGQLAARRAAEVSVMAERIFGGHVPGTMPDLILFTERHVRESGDGPSLV